MIYMKFNLCNTVHNKMAFSSIIITKNDILGFYSTNKVGTLWSVLYFDCNWQLSAKKKKTTTRDVGGNGSHSSESGTGFPPSFFVGWDGKKIEVCDAFWKKEMSPGLMRHLAWETRSQRLIFSHYLGSTHISECLRQNSMSHSLI